MKRLIAVLRRPQGIFALVSERARPFPSAQPDPDPDPYREQVVPLAAVSEAICPWRDKDVRAWRALSSVPRLNERAGLAIIRSIIGSVVDPDTPVAALPEPVFGTASVDLRPHLCAPEGEQQLLGGLAAVLDDVTAEVDFPDWHWKRRADIAALPAPFRRSFLWGLHLSPWPRVLVTLAAYEVLGLEHDEPLRRAVARLLSLASRDDGLQWCDALADLEPAERIGAAELILESGAFAGAPSTEDRRVLAGDSAAEALQELSRAAQR